MDVDCSVVSAHVQGIMIVYSVASQESFDSVRKRWMRNIEQVF